MSYGLGKSGFNKALEDVTSPGAEEPNLLAILAICDLIKSEEVKAKYAIDNIQKKIAQDNQAVAFHAALLLESVVKNCGPKIHAEVTTPAFMKFMKDQAKEKRDSVKAKLLELIQCWAHAFRDKPEYKAAVAEVYNELKNGGCDFPQLKESDAMFAAEVLPEWKEAETCYACRNTFGMITRKHHCRACGQIFCGKCSSKRSSIPKYGVDREVRVCDSCYGKINPEGAATATAGKTPQQETNLPAEYLNSSLYKQSQVPPSQQQTGGKSKEEIEEEEQLQLALAISQSEAEAKENEKKRRQNTMSLNANPPSQQSAPVPKTSGPSIEKEVQLMSPELQKYLDRKYWDQKQKEISSSQANTNVTTQAKSILKTSEPQAVVTTPSAPPPQYEVTYSTSHTTEAVEVSSVQNGAYEGVPEENEQEREDFMQALSSSIDVFVNRMNSNSLRGRSIINDSTVQTLFATLQNMHPQLLSHLQAQEEKRSYYEGLQDKLTQLRDARDALNSLRQEHEERRKAEAEEKAKRKQIQMMQKLDILRKQKQEALDRQRLVAMQRVQQQEAEMKARIEQQKQLAYTRQMQLHGFPQELQSGYVGYGMPQQQGQAYSLQQDSRLVHANVYGYDSLPHQQGVHPNSQQYVQTYEGYGSYANPYNMQGMGESLPSVNLGQMSYSQQNPIYPPGNPTYQQPPVSNLQQYSQVPNPGLPPQEMQASSSQQPAMMLPPNAHLGMIAPAVSQSHMMVTPAQQPPGSQQHSSMSQTPSNTQLNMMAQQQPGSMPPPTSQQQPLYNPHVMPPGQYQQNQAQPYGSELLISFD